MAQVARMAQMEESRYFRRFLQSFGRGDRDTRLARYPCVGAYPQMMFGRVDNNANLQSLAVFLQPGILLPLPPARGLVTDQAIGEMPFLR
jgi:hypothetical protein